MVCGDIAGSAFAIVLCSFPPIQASTMLAFFGFVVDEHVIL